MVPLTVTSSVVIGSRTTFFNFKLGSQSKSFNVSHADVNGLHWRHLSPKVSISSCPIPSHHITSHLAHVLIYCLCVTNACSTVYPAELYSYLQYSYGERYFILFFISFGTDRLALHLFIRTSKNITRLPSPEGYFLHPV